MGLLPDIDELGKLIPEKRHDDASMRLILEMLTPMQRAKIDRRMANDKWTLEKALEEQGLLICKR